MNEIQNKLSADPGATVLGIIALIISLVGCCCGILAIPAVIMSIIGLVWAVKSANTYKQSPEAYSPRSYSSIKTAKILNIIALVLSSLFVILSLVWFGNFMGDPEEFFNKLENGEFNVETDDFDDDNDVMDDTSEDIDTWEYEESTDTIDYEEEIIEMEIEEDSLNN